MNLDPITAVKPATAPLRKPRTRRDIIAWFAPGPAGVVLISAFLLGAWMIWLGTPDFPIDDAYIVQHAVHGLLIGREDRFVGGAPLDGITSPVNVMAIFALSFLLPIAWAQATATAIAVALYIVGIFRLALTYGLSKGWAGAVVLLTALAGLTVPHLLNGLETGLAMAAVVWTLILFQEPRPRRSVHYALLGVLPFVRPELTALSLLACARAVFSAGRAGMLRNELFRLLWITAGAAPVFLFLETEGAGLWPGTVAAKAYFFAQGCQPLAWRVGMATLALSGFLSQIGLAGIGFTLALGSRQRLLTGGFILIFLAAFTLRLPGGLFQGLHRYLYVLMPFTAVGWCAALSVSRGRSAIICKGIFLAALAIALFHVEDCWGRYRQEIQSARGELTEVAAWVATNIPNTDPILIHDAGVISLHGTQPLIDIVGLKTPASVALNARYNWPACSHDPRALDEIARAMGAKFFIADKEWDTAFLLTDGLRSAGWSVNRVDGVRGDTFYRVYRITPPKP